MRAMFAVRRVPRIAACAGLALWLVALGGCQTLRVGSDFDRAATFSGYHRFTVMSRSRDARNPLTVQRAQDAIQAELSRKGFVHVSDTASADFVVDFTIGARERMDIQSYPSVYVGSYWGRRGWWGYPYWGTQIDVRQYREGTLSIDIFDNATHRPVWHGWAKKDLTRDDIDHAGDSIRAGVEAVLKAFPPR